MLEFGGWEVPDDFEDNGCTYAPDRIISKDLGPACRFHDWMRAYKVVSVDEADRLFHRFLKERIGLNHGIARFYWFWVKMARPWFKRRRYLPEKWAWYGVNLNDRPPGGYA